MNLIFPNPFQHILSEKISTIGIATTLNIPGDTNFCIGASDGCLANLGSDAITNRNSSTYNRYQWRRKNCVFPHAIVNYSAMIFNYVLDDSTFISGGPVNNGGNILKWMFKTFLKQSSPTNVITKIFLGKLKNTSRLPRANFFTLFIWRACTYLG